jgi:hypothetical protein
MVLRKHGEDHAIEKTYADATAKESLLYLLKQNIAD